MAIAQNFTANTSKLLLVTTKVEKQRKITIYPLIYFSNLKAIAKKAMGYVGCYPP
ncbi:hypothetical protein [Nostoc sp. JL23]|uniref:hypothetical protein n=1 Tax=Nostoc sp. JL23 TaxID=2815394 RepID=UPI001D977B7C|nr:hypothetical protein [Nostoc sp. JL23]MBN3874985.1 hypothetical protein [Nostoc sp. JL23]